MRTRKNRVRRIKFKYVLLKEDFLTHCMLIQVEVQSCDDNECSGTQSIKCSQIDTLIIFIITK